MKKLRVNMVSESDVSVQGHGVHTAYVEMATALEKRVDVELIRGNFGKQVPCDIVHLHTIGPRTWRKLLQRGPKKVISAHVVPASFIGSIVLARYWSFAARWYMRWFYNRADLVLAVSDETKRSLIELGVTKPIEVMTNHIDTARYKHPSIDRADMRTRLGIPHDAFVVIGAGQVQPRKRVDCFFMAARQLPDVYFVWVGGIPFGKIAADNAHMMKMIKEAPENVIFPGIIPLEDMPSYYHAADLFWLPSEQETFGLVVVEAAAAGLPVMLRDLPDYDETFCSDAIRCSTDEEFVAAIVKCRDDERAYENWTQKAEAIARRFDSVEAAKRLAHLYRQLV